MSRDDVTKGTKPVNKENLISLAGFLAMAIGVMLLTARGAILGGSIIALAAQTLAMGLMVWARITFGKRSFHAGAAPTAGGLVTNGPYRYLRHPIYSSLLVIIWAGALSHLTWANAGLAALATAGGFLRMMLEERLLAKRYPKYSLYAARTKRVIPYVL